MNCKECGSYTKFNGYPFCFLKNRVLDNTEMILSDCSNKHVQKEHFLGSKAYNVTKKSCWPLEQKPNGKTRKMKKDKKNNKKIKKLSYECLLLLGILFPNDFVAFGACYLHFCLGI